MQRERPSIDGAIGALVEGLSPPLGAVARYAIGAGGKRVRPLLTVASFEMVAGVSPSGGTPVYRVAAAVELIHTYSLIHDDLPCMDDDPVRRGIPTAHRVFGPRVAVAAGAALQQIAFSALAAVFAETPDRLPRVVRSLARAAGAEGMVGGQALDLEAEGRTPDAASLEAIHRAKTAALIGASCAVGGLSAGADEHGASALSAFGTNLGLAFQIVDDLLDVEGDPTIIGKSAGADARRSKATYPSVHGMEGARRQAESAAAEAHRELRDVPGDPGLLTEFVDYVVRRVA